MKKLFTALSFILALGFASAQQTNPNTSTAKKPIMQSSQKAPMTKSQGMTKPTPSAKMESSPKPMTEVKMKKDGTPDKRYKTAQHLKKDGTPDKRYK